jgi:hypothetical protein
VVRRARKEVQVGVARKLMWWYVVLCRVREWLGNEVYRVFVAEGERSHVRVMREI